VYFNPNPAHNTSCGLHNPRCLTTVFLALPCSVLELPTCEEERDMHGHVMFRGLCIF
jgi:hypothetical protein